MLRDADGVCWSWEVASCRGVKSPLLFVTAGSVPGCQGRLPACCTKGLWELCFSLRASARQEPERLLLPLHGSVFVFVMEIEQKRKLRHNHLPVSTQVSLDGLL